MTDLDYRALPPYRLEWRPSLTARWALVASYDTHDEALRQLEAPDISGATGGQRRLVTQHVIAGRGVSIDPPA